MKIKQVTRYYCEYCKKSGGSSFHMKRHEERCTKNPNRKCGLCAIEGNVLNISETIEAIKKDIDEWEAKQKAKGLAFEDYYDELFERVSIHIIYNYTTCPACILAILRQSDINAVFDYKAAVKEFWGNHQKE